MKRLSIIALLLAVAAFVSACGGAPDITLHNATLDQEASKTVISFDVVAHSFSSSYIIQPTKDALLRDNLGNTYHVLQGSKNLDGYVKGGIVQPGDRKGTLVFPVLDPKATLVSIEIPLYSGPSIGDAVLFGFSSSSEPKWKVGIAWAKQSGKWIASSPSASR